MSIEKYSLAWSASRYDCRSLSGSISMCICRSCLSLHSISFGRPLFVFHFFLCKYLQKRILTTKIHYENTYCICGTVYRAMRPLRPASSQRIRAKLFSGCLAGTCKSTLFSQRNGNRCRLFFFALPEFLETRIGHYLT